MFILEEWIMDLVFMIGSGGRSEHPIWKWKEYVQTSIMVTV